MVDFNNVIENLRNIGFYDIFLPFILVYAIVFAILEKSGIFEKEGSEKNSRTVNAVVAFVFGLFVIASIQSVKYIQSLIVNIVVFLVFILATLIALGFIFGKDFFTHMFHDKDGKPNKGIIWTVGGIVVAVAVGILFAVLGVWDWLFESTDKIAITGEDIATVLLIIAIIGVLVWISRGSSEKESSSDTKKEE